MSSVTVLLVEDSEFLSEHVADTLRDRHGFVIVTASSAAECRERLEGGHIDCVVSNNELPDENGIELAASLNRDGDQRVPFVLFTGSSLEDLAEEAIDAGVTAFVNKSCQANSPMTIFAHRIRLAIAARQGGSLSELTAASA